MAFNLSDLLNDKTIDAAKNEDLDEVKLIPVSKLRPSTKNFYEIESDRVRKLAASIEMLSTDERLGIQQNLVVRELPDSDDYEIVSGETRWQAVNLLLAEKRTELQEVPCKIERGGDPVRDELILILTNSTQRERSDAEKMKEIERLRKLLQEYKKTHKLGTSIQKAIAEILDISKTKVGTLDHINNNLLPELKEDYEQGLINTAVANKLAGLDADVQTEARNLLYDKGKLSVADVEDFVLTGSEGCGKDNPENGAASGDMDIHFKVDMPDDDAKVTEDSISFNMPMPEVESQSQVEETNVKKPDAHSPFPDVDLKEKRELLDELIVTYRDRVAQAKRDKTAPDKFKAKICITYNALEFYKKAMDAQVSEE